MAQLAHLSDLHLGVSVAHRHVVEQVVEQIQADRIDVVLVTGDLTHRGRAEQFALFNRLFEPLKRRCEVVLVPGNHDRCGDDIGKTVRGHSRVSVVQTPALYLVRVDSTASHNRIFFQSHGDVCKTVLSDIDAALDAAPPGAAVAIALHHHVVPLPVEGFWETVSVKLHLGWEAELKLGGELLKRARGRCDYVFHGHRHVPRAFVIDGESERPLRIYNAGSTSELAAFRCFELGSTFTEPHWVHASRSPRPSPHTAQTPALALQLS